MMMWPASMNPQWKVRAHWPPHRYRHLKILTKTFLSFLIELGSAFNSPPLADEELPTGVHAYKHPAARQEQIPLALARRSGRFA